MTQLFREDGTMIPVTVVLAGPCPVTQVKTVEHDGYDAVQMAFQPSAKNSSPSPKWVTSGRQALRLTATLKNSNSTIAQSTLSATLSKQTPLPPGDKVDVTGTSKGKGFAGNIKRWNQARGRKTHGSHSYRVAGSMGACTYPGEVFKTKHLPGHMGHERITVQNLEVVRADAERNLLLIKGAIPGAKGGLVLVRSTVK